MNGHHNTDDNSQFNSNGEKKSTASNSKTCLEDPASRKTSGIEVTNEPLANEGPPMVATVQ